jgi:hypothetical protein
VPPIVGIFFNGMGVLSQARKSAPAELAAPLAERERALRAMGPGVVSNVRRTEDLLTAAGLPVPEAPQTIDGYYRWSEKVTPSVHQALLPHANALSAHTLGLVLGDASLSLNLLAIVHHLLDAAPQHPWLLEQAAALLGDLGKDTMRLATILALPKPTLPPASVALARKALLILQAVSSAPAPPPVPLLPGEEVRALQAALRELSENVLSLERSLG